MKKYLILIALLFITQLFVAVSATNAPNIEWQKYPEEGVNEFPKSVIQTSDGGYVVSGGYYMGIPSDIDLFVSKLNSNGDIEWQKCHGGSNTDFGDCIIQTSDGGYAVAGYTYSKDGDLSDNHGEHDLWVVKLDLNGNLEWQKCYGGSYYDSGAGIIQTSDGGYAVAGSTSSTDGDVSGNNGSSDFWILKLDSVGNLEWQKCYGGSREEGASGIIQTSDGGYVVVGSTVSKDGDVTGNHNYTFNDFWILKLNSNGNLEWQKCLGGSDGDFASGIVMASDGGYVVAGLTKSTDGDVNGNHGMSDFWVVKLSSNGDLEWQECLGGSREDSANSIKKTSDGGYVVAGTTSSSDEDVAASYGYRDFWIVKLNSDGNLEWQKCHGGIRDDVVYDIVQTFDGGYVFTGETGLYSPINDELTDDEYPGNNGCVFKLGYGYVTTSTPTNPPASTQTISPTITNTPLPSPTYDAQAEIESLREKTKELEEKSANLEERLAKQETLVEMIMNYFHSIFG